MLLGSHVGPTTTQMGGLEAKHCGGGEVRPWDQAEEGSGSVTCENKPSIFVPQFP